MRIGKMTSNQSFAWTCTNQTTSWLVDSLSTFVVRTNHEQIRIHKIYHGPDLGEVTTFPLIVCSMLGHMIITQMAFFSPKSRVEVPKFPKLGLPRLWGPIILGADLWLTWSLKQSFNHCQELSNGMSHVPCMQGNQGNFKLLVVGNQIGNLTFDLSFGHNLCLKCPNGSCEPILDI
jgi:hypothetical protein